MRKCLFIYKTSIHLYIPLSIYLSSEEDEELDLEGIDDEEIDSYIMCSEEIKLKTKIWLKVRD